MTRERSIYISFLGGLSYIVYAVENNGKTVEKLEVELHDEFDEIEEKVDEVKKRKNSEDGSASSKYGTMT